MIMNPWPILGARDNNDDCDDEDSAETRGLSGHQAWSQDTLFNQSGQRFLILDINVKNRLREGKERENMGDVKFFREIFFKVLINN